MADLCVSPSCGQVQPADPTAMPIDAAEAVLIPVEELKKAAEKLEADFSKIETKIHRFPARLRCLSKDGCYIVPSVVAIGPYHRRLPQLQKTEEVKKAAAYNFCIDSGNSAEEVYKKILSVSGDVRSCYDDRDEAVAAGMDDAEFAAMMFHDGCFLLQFIIFETDGVVARSLHSWFLSNHAALVRDIILLENQLPWLVFDALMTFSSVPVGQLTKFIAKMGESFDVCVDSGKKSFDLNYARYKPPHLLGLLRFYQSESMTGEGMPEPDHPQGITPVSQSSSAVELAEIGIKLVASKTTRFKDMGIKLGPLHGGKNFSGGGPGARPCLNPRPSSKFPSLYGKLFLAPLVMHDHNACCLVNMVALEECTPDEDDIVTSYISLFAMLTNREEDVHELRVKSILYGDFSDQQTLDFFKNLVKLLSIPTRHMRLLAQLEAYKRERWVWIAVHKFVYNNFKTIVTVQPADPTAKPIDAEELKKAAEKLEADFSNIETKIHRFPARLRCLSKDDDRYIVPRFVAIGPYHRGLPQLQEMEEVKNAVAYNFRIKSGNSIEEVYKKILSVSGDARSCYDEAAAAGMGDAEFATMMYRDGCFLLQLIILQCTNGEVAPSLKSWFFSNVAGLLRDIFLLENQLPWLVFDALMAFSSVPVPVGQFIAEMGASFDVCLDFSKKPSDFNYAGYNPPHLLGLLRFYQSGSTTGEGVHVFPKGTTLVSQSSSAVELAEIGIKLVASKTTRFKDMGIKKLAPLYDKLFLAPLVMDYQNACCLVNMVALEECTPIDKIVTSYICLLAMLMNREADVHELRVKSILYGDFSDQQTLDFFKNHVKLLSLPSRHVVLLAELEAYKRKRWVWIAVHKFVYNNFKIIVTVLSVIGVLVGIFKTLPSHKQHQH